MDENIFLDVFRRRIKNNKNCLIIFTGDTGSGKSYAALRFAENLDPEFNWKRVVFTPDKFLEIIKYDKTLHSGNVIIFDEAGVGMASREWYSIQNKILSYVLQTFRFKNLIVIFTVPDFTYIDSQARKLFHFYFETSRILRKQKVCRCKPFRISVSRRTGKVYYVYPRFKIDGTLFKLTACNFKMPSARLRKKYEKLKEVFADDLYLKGIDSLDKGTKGVLTPDQKLVYELLKVGLSYNNIAKRISKKPANVRTIAYHIRDKGITLPEKR